MKDISVGKREVRVSVPADWWRSRTRGTESRSQGERRGGFNQEYCTSTRLNRRRGGGKGGNLGEEGTNKE